jgi:hypothetical protein
MLVGLFLVAVAANFLFGVGASPGDSYFRLDPASSALCGASVAAIGGLLVLSTYGRWRKVRALR